MNRSIEGFSSLNACPAELLGPAPQDCGAGSLRLGVFARYSFFLFTLAKTQSRKEMVERSD